MASFPLKIQYRGVIKRAQFTYGDLSKDKAQNMEDMYNIIKSLFGINKPNSNIHLTFLDEENDSISFSSDRELDAAFSLVKSEGWKSFKVNVEVDSVSQPSSSGEGVIGLKIDKGKKDKEKEKEKNIKKSVSPSPLDAVVGRDNTKLSAPAISKKEPKPKAKATFIANANAPAFVPKNEVPESIKAEKSLKSTSTVTSVPLRTTSGGAYIYPDGTVEFGMGGEAFLLPDGKTVSCTLSYRGFPSVAAAGTVLTEGKWYYEVMILTDGLMQIGWADTKFEGNSNVGEGVGDDSHSIAYDGKRKLKWHNGRSQPFGNRWKAGDVVCCAANLDDGIVKFALNGKWSDRSTAFSSLIFHDGLMPAASFSKGEKLCFNFGSSSSGFVHGPPNEEYLPVYIAQGNANTMKKMKKVVEKQQERKKRMMKEVVGKTTAMPPPPPLIPLPVHPYDETPLSVPAYEAKLGTSTEDIIRRTPAPGTSVEAAMAWNPPADPVGPGAAVMMTAHHWTCSCDDASGQQAALSVRHDDPGLKMAGEFTLDDSGPDEALAKAQTQDTALRKKTSRTMRNK